MRMPDPFALYDTPLPPGIHVIEASAGTGKTYTLAQLVARLLLEDGLPIEQILVVTFTNAAAAELRERIHARLAQLHHLLDGAACDDPALSAWLRRLDPDNARQRLARALRDMDLAAIHTIDAFGIQVARRHALALGLAEDSTLLDDAAELDRLLIDRLWQENIQTVSRQAPELVDGLADAGAVFELCDKAGPYARFEDEVADFDQALRTFLKQEGDNPLRQAAARQKLGRALADLLRDPPAPLKPSALPKAWRVVVTPLLRGGFPDWTELPKGAPDVASYIDQLAYAKDREKWQQALPAPLKLELAALDALWPHFQRLRPAWLRHLHRQWAEARQARLEQRGLFTFDSLRHRLAEAVDGPLADTLRARYHACLIDEFQDTDPDQWRIFSTLFRSTDEAPKRLFLIGDPKQAIYAFRGANVETYHLAVQQADHHYTLDTNYRSHSALIEGFNLLFAERDDAPTFLDPRCRYHPVRAGVNDETVQLTLDGAPFNRIRLLHPAPHAEPDAVLAQLCADIVTLLERGRLGANQRSLRPRDIAVLVPTHDHAARVQTALRRCGVPSVRSAPDSLWKTATSEALLTLMQAMLDPRDSGALNAFLIGPLMRWPVTRLTDGVAVAETRAHLSEARRRWQGDGIMAALTGLFDQLACWQTLAAHEDGERRIADLRHLIERLQQQALDDRLPPLELFRWALRAWRDDSDRDTLRLESDENAVEIATIFASKGLQYPVTLVYGDWKAKSARTPYAVAEAEGRRIGFSEALKTRLQTAQQQEQLRLFYVACTRAESHLGLYLPGGETGVLRHLLGTLSEEDTPPPRRQVLDDRPDLFETVAVQEAPTARWQPPAEPLRWRAPPEPPGPVRATLLSSFTALARRQPEAVEDPSLQARADTDPLLEAPADDDLPAGARFGTLFHDLMERLPHFQPDDAEVDRLIMELSHHHGLPLNESQRTRLRQQVRNTLGGRVGGFTLAQLPPHRWVRERGFVLDAPDLSPTALNRLMAGWPGWSPLHEDTARAHLRHYLQGFVDLTVEVDGRYHIIDYKTNRLARHDAPALAEAMAAHHYLLQALIYMVALHRTLRFSLGADYDPVRHLGDAHYLFVRGMRAGSDAGVFSAGFTPTLIAEADRLFGGSS